MNLINILKLLTSAALLMSCGVSKAVFAEPGTDNRDPFSVVSKTGNVQYALFYSHVIDNKSSDFSLDSSTEQRRSESSPDDESINLKNISETYATMVSPVPEPESYVLFLVGLVLIGFTARRRDTDVK